MSEIPKVPPLSRAAIYRKAGDLVREYYPDAWLGKEPVPVDMLFEIDAPDLLKIETGYTDISDKCGVQAYGYTNLDQRISYVDHMVANATGVKGRRFYRSTAGHELGHCFLHIPLDRWRNSLQMLGVGLTREQKGLKAFEDPEWQAWQFCQELCMPSHLVEKFLTKYSGQTDAVQAMIEHFDVSFSFVQKRVRDLLKNHPNAAATTLGHKYVRKPKWTGNLTKPETRKLYTES